VYIREDPRGVVLPFIDSEWGGPCERARSGEGVEEEETRKTEEMGRG